MPNAHATLEPVIIANIFYRIKIAFIGRQKSTNCSNQFNIENTVPFANSAQGFLEYCLLIYGTMATANP
ncbi:MAG: hypothetical protein KAG53_02025 [Endozoicomonadaceae bacterium]|nr:hypothetical protein [Endozoicomonadaceae bacterium]